MSFGIRRIEFDDYLLRRSGARVSLGTPVRSLKQDGDGWAVNETIRAPLVVGAGGNFCPVARHLCAGLGADETVIAAQEIEFEMDEEQQRLCLVAEDRPELSFCDDLKGYGWVVRKGNFLNIGLGREDPHELPAHVSAFCERLRQQGRIPPGIPARFHGHAYALYPSARRPLVGDGLLLVGDAAGLADPKSGEGIRPAVESAILAADAIVSARGDFRRSQLEPYVAQLATRFGKRCGDATPAASGGHALTRALARWLLRREWFARHVVIDRWFLRRHQHPLPA